MRQEKYNTWSVGKETLKEGDELEDLGLDDRIILKYRVGSVD
jgi:hypothetical protein